MPRIEQRNEMEHPANIYVSGIGPTPPRSRTSLLPTVQAEKARIAAWFLSRKYSTIKSLLEESRGVYLESRRFVSFRKCNMQEEMVRNIWQK